MFQNVAVNLRHRQLTTKVTMFLKQHDPLECWYSDRKCAPIKTRICINNTNVICSHVFRFSARFLDSALLFNCSSFVRFAVCPEHAVVRTEGFVIKWLTGLTRAGEFNAKLQFTYCCACANKRFQLLRIRPHFNRIKAARVSLENLNFDP